MNKTIISRGGRFLQARTKILRGFGLCTVALLGCLAACSPDFDLKPEEVAGYKIYKEYCGQCHRLQSPALHTAEDWPAVVRRMHTHMVEMKRNILDETQTEKLLVFLKGHAAN